MLDGLMNNLKAKAKSASEKLGEMADESALRRKLKKLAAEKSKMYEFIGMEIFDLYAADQYASDAVAPFCEKIKELNADIERTETDIAQYILRCECGAKLAKDVKFCPSCGRSVNRIVAAPPPVELIECVCGAKLEVGTPMCMECGRRIAEH